MKEEIRERFRAYQDQTRSETRIVWHMPIEVVVADVVEHGGGEEFV